MSVVILIVAGLDLVLGSATHGQKLVVAPTTTAPVSTTAPPGLRPARPPAQVRVDVLNGSGVSTAGSTKAAALTAAGYHIANTGVTATQPSTIVECRTGFEVDVIVLARAVGPGTLIQAFPNVDPPGARNADCVLLIGA